jgi:putative nucleotidyltransferase with HDIG domain
LQDGGEIPFEVEPLVLAGRAAEREGRQQEARARFEEALHTLRDPAHAALAGSLLRWIARAYANGGESDVALDCLAVAEVLAEAQGDYRALASVLNTRAATLFSIGELDEAEVLFRRVRGLAWKIRDLKLQAMADQNLGSVYSIRGDLRLALARFRASLTAFEELGLRDYQGPLINNIGRLLTDLGEEAEAEATFDRARTLCQQTGDKHHQIWVEVNRARLLLRTERLNPSLQACHEARMLAFSTGEDGWLAQIHLIAGSAYTRLEKHDLALAFLERADGLARARKDAKLLADIVLEQAGVFRALGRNPETLRRLNEAHHIFQRLRAQRELADVDTRLANLEQTFLQITRSWGESIESRDAYTQGHCSRVSDYACLIASAAGLPEEDMTWFRMGALLHDVGKINVPLEILNKKGSLDADEFKVMSQHPVIGVELLDGVEFPWDVRPMIRHHHERWDGNGYPDKLAGDQIPFAARILTVADVYDALTTARSYRPGFPHEKAMQIMSSERGTTFDPDLLDVFSHQVAPKLAPPAKPRRELVLSIPFPFVRAKARLDKSSGMVSASA